MSFWKRRHEIRRNKRTRHPSVIYKEKDEKCRSVGLTHAKKTFGKRNLKLRKNPNPVDKSNSHIVKRVQEQKKESYGVSYSERGWALSKRDRVRVDRQIRKLERKQRIRKNKLKRQKKRKK